MRLWIGVSLALMSWEALGFCGFYVAKAGSDLYNKASKVVFVRHQDKTVISMMNDYQGSLKDFAMVVPVPSVLKKKQIRVGDPKVFARVDAFTAPRLVEYHDPDPCSPPVMFSRMATMQEESSLSNKSSKEKKSLGVTVEAKYTVGEYDIVILSAKESDGLENWLVQNHYKIPKGASQALRPYIKQGMKFFVAKINLKKKREAGLQYLRPLQIALNTEKFMLPIRLGMLNAKEDQELFLYVITKDGRVETSNYQTKYLPSDKNIPVYIKDDFPHFYRSMFNYQLRKNDHKVVFTEYFWDMSWCDPCAADPLTPAELKSLGVFWLKDHSKGRGRFGRPVAPVSALVTRLHLRYNKKTFPSDLEFIETKDRQNFQGRYVLNHPWKGKASCDEAKEYRKSLPERLEEEAQELASLTGWKLKNIRSRMGVKPRSKDEDETSWIDRVWK